MQVLRDQTDVAFAVTADSGELEKQAVLLVRSIRNLYPDAPLLIFIPESSTQEMNNDALQYLKSAGHVVLGSIPIPEYPISALVQAFVEAEQVFDTEYLVALDTDTLVLNNLRVAGNGDVWLRPADVGAQYWTTEEAHDDWKVLYRRFDLDPPDRSEELTASVDRQIIPPYWNSGVVITTDRSLPSRWLEYTHILFSDDTLPIATDEFFLDQISLALAVRNNDVANIGECENFPLGGRLFVSPDVAVLHYGNRRNLARILQPNLRSNLQRKDAIPPIGVSDGIYSFLTLLSTKSGRILSYRRKMMVRNIVNRLLPDSIVK